ncbi:MAG TPA: hypothetical protein VFV02_16225 [Acidimicrobiales bacterium]|nr:hypothetical protein [Acidimicrobiales bacterium]
MLADMATTIEDLGRARWRGSPGRVEVWYATLSSADGTGYWIHHETVAPSLGHGDPYRHGWAAVFPVDGSPELVRFGPEPVGADTGEAWFSCGPVEVRPGHLNGSAGNMSWELSYIDNSPPLYTFPRLAWERELLPGAQIVPWPSARFSGTVRLGGHERSVEARGAVARIYGHANAERWCWLHADLGGEDVLEIVSAVPRRAGLRRLPPVAMVALRRAGQRDWPPKPVLGVGRFRTRISDGRFDVMGRVGRRRLRVEVSLPAERCVALTYADPDGSTATCTNTERADTQIAIERWRKRWNEEQRWSLTGTAHAEIGVRP